MSNIRTKRPEKHSVITKSSMKVSKKTRKTTKKESMRSISLSKYFTNNPRKLVHRKKISVSPLNLLKSVSIKAIKVAVYNARLLFVLLVAAISIGFISKHSTSTTSYDTITPGSIFKQSKEAPAKITTTGPSQTDTNFSTYPTWAQNFAASKSASKLNGKYWEVIQGPAQNDNKEAEYYTNNPKNLHINNGALTLEATAQNEPGGYKYASARIDTQGKVSFLYGRIDITAKVPTGIGTWPAVWMLPANNKYENMSPSSNALRYLNGGELDMIEEVGINPNINYGVVHTISAFENNPNGVGAYNQILIPGNDVNYNKYSILWTPSTITYELNNTPFFTYSRQAGSDYTTWPFDQPFYLIANLALGGVWGGQDTAQFPGNGIDNSALPAHLDIQSIYYYPFIGDK